MGYAASKIKMEKSWKKICRNRRWRFSPQTAYLMTDLLRAVVTSGTGARAQELGRPTGGKTGNQPGL